MEKWGWQWWNFEKNKYIKWFINNKLILFSRFKIILIIKDIKSNTIVDSLARNSVFLIPVPFRRLRCSEKCGKYFVDRHDFCDCLSRGYRIFSLLFYFKRDAPSACETLETTQGAQIYLYRNFSTEGLSRLIFIFQ